MDSFEKWMSIWFTPHQSTTPPKMDFLPKTFLQIILAAKWLVQYTYFLPLFYIGLAMFYIGLAIFYIGLAMFNIGFAMFNIGLAIFTLPHQRFTLA